jgi:hypothetical protein
MNRCPGNGLVLTGDTSCLGLDLLPDLLKVKELLIGQVQELCSIRGIVHCTLRRT